MDLARKWKSTLTHSHQLERKDPRLASALENTIPKLLNHHTGHANFLASTWQPREAGLFHRYVGNVLHWSKMWLWAQQQCKMPKKQEKLLEKEARERDLAQAAKNHHAATHCKEETLNEDTKVYRVKVVMALMQAGIPIAKLELCQGLRRMVIN